MKFFWEQDAVFLRLVKYLGKNRTSISRIILNGPFSPMVRLAPVSPTTTFFPKILTGNGRDK